MVVAHDGATWLPRTLESLREQSRPADVVVAVDTGSGDGCADLLRDALGTDHVLTAGRETGFGAAVRQGLEHARAQLSGARPDGAADWLWVLHDDCAPDPRALELLLDTAAASSSVGVVGAKLVDWDDPGLLLEVGLTVGRSGRRDTGLDGVERDQGQHDHRSDVLAVPSAGLLVRGDVWDELGGFDPSLALLRDDIDLCWRAQLAGHRVVLAPRARVADAQASARGLRSVDAVPGGARAVRRVDRQHGQHVALARCSWVALPFVLAWVVLVGLGRAAGMLAAKAPGRALEEVRALAVTVLLPWRWLRSRRRVLGRRRVPGHSLSALLTPRSAPLRRAAEVLFGWTLRDPDDEPTGSAAPTDPAAAESGPTAEEAEAAVATPTRWPARVLRHPLTTVLLVVLAVTAVAWRSLLGSLLRTGSLTGGELRPSPAGAAQLWHAGTSAVRGAGLGTEQLASPAAVVHAGWVWLVARVASGDAPAVSTALLLLLAPALAAVSAYLAARVATRSRALRAWAALAWGLAPLLTTAVGQGRLGPVAVSVFLPLVAALIARALTRRATGALTATFAAALGLAGIGSAVPLLAAVGVAVALAGVVLAHGAARLRALLLVLLPPALLGPWLADLVRDPRLLLAGPGAVSDVVGVRTTSTGLRIPAAWTELVRLPGTVPLWAVGLWLAPLVLLALLSLTRGGARGRAVAALGWVAVLGLGLAVLVPSVPLTRSGEVPLTGWAGAGALVGLLAVVAAPVVAADGLQQRLARHGFGWRQMLLGPLVAIGVLAPLVAGAAWAVQGPGELRHTAGRGLPPVAADAATGPDGARTLVLAADGSRLTYRLDGGEPGAVARDYAAPVRLAGDAAVADAVQTLASTGTSATGEEVVAGLHRLAVGFVLVRQPVPPALADRLDATAGLARIGRSADGQMWRVGSGTSDVAARARIEGTDGAVQSVVPVSGPHGQVDARVGSGVAGRLLVLAESRSTLRQATLDGVRLAAATPAGPDSWRQAFRLPAHGGHLVVTTVDPTVRTWRLAELGLLVLVALLALPVRRPSGELR